MEGTAADALTGDFRKPALDLVHPRRTRRGEVQVISGMSRKPFLNLRMLVRPIVVQDDVHCQGWIDRAIHAVEEANKLLAKSVACDPAPGSDFFHLRSGIVSSSALKIGMRGNL